MNRASWVYIAMILSFGAGLWGILSFGSLLQAPEDLAGQWELRHADQSSSNPRRMTIEQSGRYFEIAIEGQPRLKFKLKGQRTDGPEGSMQTVLSLANSKSTLLIRGESGGDDFDFTLNRFGQEQILHGRRVARAFPLPSQPPRPATQPVPTAHARR